MKHANIALFVPHMGCPHQCSFCNQKSITGEAVPTTPQSVREALLIAEQSLGEEMSHAELAFFGGSFTAIDRSYMCGLLQEAQPYLQKNKLGGIRISTRPDAIDQEVLDLLKKMGVTSIELGAQSMDDTVLIKNDRGHTVQDVINASILIRQNGFSLGLQMMTGLYGSTPDSDRITAYRLAELCPDTVRIYPTIVMKGTKLEEYYRSGNYLPMKLEDAVLLCAELLDFFEKKSIRVIRLGLHDGADLERDYVAGAWHPAFRELCEGQRYFVKAITLLREQNIPQGEVILWVHPSAISQMVGQKKKNMQRLAACGYRVSVKASAEIPVGEVKIERNGISILRTE